MDERLKVHIPRDAMDLRQYITGLTALIAQSLGLDPFAWADHVFLKLQADHIRLRA
ncbi:hypothetical protein [Malikia spinosa]|uniref:hypothetical protein n=1 Tax=Malikia spinosa TaxID=86180 RepID=UPI002FD90C0B